jgi:nucleoside-diphosphate-sugar epimerase
MKPRMLVTGAAGFIGRHVVEEALRRGYRVRGTDRRATVTKGIEFVKADIRDEAQMTRLTQDQDCVVHLAAITSNVEFLKNPQECYDINVNGFLKVIDAAARSGCKRFVYASSAAVYLDSFSEDTMIDLRRQGNHYAKTKLMNEMVAKSYEHIHTMRVTGLRYFNVYGNRENTKGDYASIVTIFRKARKNRESLVVYGDGKQARDLIYVRDAARVTVDLLEKGEEDLYNVGTGASTPYTAIAEMIDRHNIKYVPNPLPDYQYYTRADATRLRRALGDYEFVDLANGITMLEV